MTLFLRYALLAMIAFSFSVQGFSQAKTWREMHKVKRNETIFGIAKQYGLTVNELIKANPEMNTPGYELKKGDYIFIPYPTNEQAQKPATNATTQPKITPKTQGKTLKVGVMLPLHNIDGDGRRMTEYYRGFLMACDELKKEGLSIDIKAWNVPQDAEINATGAQNGMAGCDLIFGPLYTKQVATLANVAKNVGAKLVIPFSISGNDVATNQCIYQVYQSPEVFFGEVIRHFLYRYSNYNVVVIDCNDRSSDKGVFTFNLRKQLQERNISCNVTNLNSSDEMFFKSFSAVKPNMVILNTGRSPELTKVLNRLDELTGEHPSLAVSLFGYTEWLMYEKYDKDKFFKYDTYIPTTSYYNQYSSKVRTLEAKYRSLFKSDMMDYLPRFAITGYDHAMFFLHGVSKQGKKFVGADADKNAVQTQLHFTKTNSAGGYQNTGFMFVHYNRDKSISTISF